MRIYILLIILFVNVGAFAQELTKDDLYKQAMENAKVAFNAQQYSTAVMFYREAQRISPDALLPRYKIEDIRTIYIANEMDTMELVKQKVLVVEDKKKKKKEREAEQVVMAQIAQEQATERMNADAEKQKQALAELKIEAQSLEIDEELDDPIEEAVDGLAPDLEPGLNKVSLNKATSIETSQPERPQIKGEIKQVPPVIEAQKPEQKAVVEPVKEPIKEQAKPSSHPVKVGMSAEEKAVWVETEKKRLAAKYPDSKTIEEIEKPGKHITRVIMHVENKVTVYLKVKHSWGAIYFFIDEPGQELKSINEQYFNLKTNLKTYEGY